MLQRVLCPVLVGRDEQLFLLEDALLAAHSGDSRFVLLGGEAGMGKTRLATELAKRAQRLGWAALWGGCSEAELALPYLPIVEAAGNYLETRGVDEVAAKLGPAREELAQLFPQLGVAPAAAAGDPAQAKLRLFEAVVALLSVPAREQGLLLVVEDLHWADAATRELLDHLARRVTSLRSVVLATYRTDELDRRHPLTSLVQSWRRSGLAETVLLEPLAAGDIGRMIEAIVEDDVGNGFRDLMHRRTEGNPFVLEEMLKETVDRGEELGPGHRWTGRAVEELRIPETVREAILLRVDRLDPAHVGVLEAAAVLGRTFSYDTLAHVVEASADVVQDALAAATAQQLLVERSVQTPVYEWRHALTQEAIADSIVLPRQQQIHSRAADALRAVGASSLEVVRHLLAAGRFEEAVPACLAAADEAEAALAFREAVELIERALPHTREQALRTRLLCRMGRALWFDSQPQAAEKVLDDGIAGLEAEGDLREAAGYRLIRGRCRWELSRPPDALEDFEGARRALEADGPSADLAVAYMRIAGLHKFEFDDELAVEAAERAVATAAEAGADFERVWAQSWLAFALYDSGRVEEGDALLEAAFAEARERGYSFIAANIAYNDAWTRLHTLAAEPAAKLDAVSGAAAASAVTDLESLMRATVLRATGHIRVAFELADQARITFARASMRKFHWRAEIETAECLLELGLLDDAASTLPAVSERTELQDVVYDAAPQIRLRLVSGDVDGAVALAREIARDVGKLALYAEVIALAVEAFVSAGLLEEAEELVRLARSRRSLGGGSLLLDQSEGRILLARGVFERSAELLEPVAAETARRDFRLVELRTRTLLAEAMAGSGRRDEAERELKEVAAGADEADAALIRAGAEAVAERTGLAVAAPSRDGTGDEVVAAGERLVTSLFADVRGFAGIAAELPPAELADRMGALHRWAANEVRRHHGFVDKFAGDAVMATFNASGARLDHTEQALEAALALSGKASLLDLGVGIGIAVGPAVVAQGADGANVSVLGTTTNLAARLQTVAGRGEVVLSDEAHRRVAGWLSSRGLTAAREEVELKGFDGMLPAWRLNAA
jgi:class 3 adenylate cyclase